MNTLFILGCGSKKLDHAAPAGQIYVGSYFRATSNHARIYGQPEHTLILSAKHGLLRLDQVIAPYNVALDELTEGERLRLFNRVIRELKSATDTAHPPLRIVVLAGADYADLVTNARDAIWRTENGPPVRRPLAGMGMPQQREWLLMPPTEATCTVELPDHPGLEPRENERLRDATRAASTWWAAQLLSASPPGEPSLFADAMARELWHEWPIRYAKSREWPEDTAFIVPFLNAPGGLLDKAFVGIGLQPWEWWMREWSDRHLMAEMTFSMNKVTVSIENAPTETIFPR